VNPGNPYRTQNPPPQGVPVRFRPRAPEFLIESRRRFAPGGFLYAWSVLATAPQAGTRSAAESVHLSMQPLAFTPLAAVYADFISRFESDS